LGYLLTCLFREEKKKAESKNFNKRSLVLRNITFESL
jgi:hypothetical protein